MITWYGFTFPYSFLSLGIIPRGIYKHKVVDLPRRAHLFSDENKGGKATAN